MIKRIGASLVVIALLVSSCGPSPEQIQTAIAETQAAIPTATIEPTATPKPITGADIEAVLYQAGDLPPEYSLGQYKMDAPEGWPQPLAFRGIVLPYDCCDGLLAGRVDVAFYTEPVAVDMFKSVAELSGDPVDGLGDTSIFNDERIDFFAGVYGWLIYDVDVAWTRCDYFVHVNTQTETRSGVAITYARRLDERLAEVLCP
mgnify:CR=1 FL=1